MGEGIGLPVRHLGVALDHFSDSSPMPFMLARSLAPCGAICPRCGSIGFEIRFWNRRNVGHPAMVPSREQKVNISSLFAALKAPSPQRPWTPLGEAESGSWGERMGNSSTILIPPSRHKSRFISGGFRTSVAKKFLPVRMDCDRGNGRHPRGGDAGGSVAQARLRDRT